MTPEEINTRMNILLGLRGFSIVKLTEKTALWRMVSDDELLIDVSFPPELWEAKHAGKTLDWVKSPEMPANLKGMIEALVEDYTEALKAALDGIEEYHDDPSELPHDVPEAVVSQEVEDAQKASEEAEKLAKLEAIMDGEAEPETRVQKTVRHEKLAKLEAIMDGEAEPETRVQKTVRHEKPAQRMPAVIPVSMRDIQIKELSIDDIKQYICPAATDQEAFLFLKLCQARQLNPFLNEAYLIKYGDKATMTVGKEAFMRRAEAHPQFDGYEAGIIIQNADKTLERREGTFILKNEVLVGGWAKIYRKDRRQPFVSEVALHEYNTGKSLWISKPATMIRKVAIVQGKREAFPSEFGGMYDQSEVDGGIIEADYMEVGV